MHTTPDTDINTIETTELLAIRTQIELERLRLELTMIRVQTKALETLERLMDDPEPTGNEKQDRFEATKRNRQRLAANQVLIHCRTAEREKRLAKTNRQQKGLEPNRASDGQQAPENEMPTPPSPLEGRPEPSDHQSSDRATGGSPASAGPDQPEPRSDHTTSGCAADPSPQSSPARSVDGGEGGQTPPSPLAGEGGRASDRMRGRSETSDRSDNTYPKPSPKRSRYKVRKPKHPRRSRKRKRGR